MEDADKSKLKRMAMGGLKDIVMAFIVVVIVMGILLAYCRVWPPVVVVESGSMMHGVNSQIGIIDTGDMVLVKYVESRDEISSYVEAEASNFRHYGEYGNVVIYRPNGEPGLTPIIHRAVVWLEVNETRVRNLPSGVYDYANCTFDAPALGQYDEPDYFVLEDYGYKERDVIIDVQGILYNYAHYGDEPQSGYVTMGDNNAPAYDQRQGGYQLVQEEWIVGRALGELPWFGLIKLTITGDMMGSAPPNSWPNLIASILILLGIPLFIDFGLPRIRGKKNDDQEGEKEAETDSDDRVAESPAEDSDTDGAKPAEEDGPALDKFDGTSEEKVISPDAEIKE